MDHQLLCSWLSLPAGSWPPNHFVLLGLEPGVNDAATIEASVHERMGILRRYQLTNPELATEAMNRLAQAMICLTDEVTRVSYVAQVAPELSVSPSAPAAEVLDAPAAEVKESTPPAVEVVQQPTPPPAAPAPEPIAPAPLELSAIHTRRDLYFRIARTRQIQQLWASVGKHLHNPRHRLARPAEAADLIHHMQLLTRLIQTYPSQLGQAGQPGYLVLALARQQLIVPTLQTLQLSQRTALARDWKAGQEFLIEQNSKLRARSRTLRRRSPWSHLVRLSRSVLNNHPGLVVLSLSLLALNVAYPWLRLEWARQLALIVGLIVIRLVVWWARSRPTELPIRKPPAATPRKGSPPAVVFSFYRDRRFFRLNRYTQSIIAIFCMSRFCFN